MPANAEGVHRLKDILVEEVSLVDRPANKRRFLLVKRAGNASMSTLRSNGRGGFTRVTKADEEESDEEKARKAAEAEEEEKARKAKDAEEEKRKEAEKAKGKPPPFAGAAKPFGPKEGESEEDARKRIFEEESAKRKQAKADGSGEALAAQIRDHIEELEALCEELDEHEDEEPSDVHMQKLAGCHKKLGGMCEKFAKRGDAKKRGAKMAQRRLESFKAALSTLAAILGELMETPGKASQHAADAGDPQAPPKGWSAQNPSGVPSGAGGVASGWSGGKRAPDAPPAQDPELVKKVADLTTEVERLKRSPASPNSAGAERGRTQKREPASVAWPLDMARENTRDKVGKDVSFFDAD
jgi:hypothetical protein